MDPSLDDAAHTALGQRRAANAPAALLGQLVTAVRLLTALPLPGRAAPIGESALFFPLVGLALGGLLVLVDRVTVPVAGPVMRDALLVGTLAAVTGGRPLRQLGRTAAVLALPRVGTRGAATAGTLAVASQVALTMASLGALAAPTRTAALLYAPMLARWSMVVLAFGSHAAGPDDPGRTLVRDVKFREFGVATVGALWIVLANATARGLLAILAVAIVTIGFRILVHTRLGGVGGDLLGAIGEINQMLVLATFTLGGH